MVWHNMKGIIAGNSRWREKKVEASGGCGWTKLQGLEMSIIEDFTSLQDKRQKHLSIPGQGMSESGRVCDLPELIVIIPD